MICSIHDRDLPQLINYMLPIVSKQGYALGLFFIANNATLVKLQKKKKKKKKNRKETGDFYFEKKHALVKEFDGLDNSGFDPM